MDSVIELIEEKNKSEWEQTRFISYIIAQVNSTKKLKPTDLIKFDWDEKKVSDDIDIQEIKRRRDLILLKEYEGNRGINRKIT